MYELLLYVRRPQCDVRSRGKDTSPDLATRYIFAGRVAFPRLGVVQAVSVPPPMVGAESGALGALY